MSFKNSPVLSLELPTLQRLPVAALLVSGMVMPWLAGLPYLYRLLCAVLSFGLVAAELYRSGWHQLKLRIVRISWQQDGSFLLQFAEGEPMVAQLSPRSWRTPWLVCLTFQPPINSFGNSFGRSCSVMLWRAQCSRQAWHQWQLRLRLEGYQVPPRDLLGVLR